jgi:UDP-N-acetylglucosamine--N-acetylmuramyl-(pentapeptide) pyrophosphoryl-undecaprenol N-acetylglucosamine transferase
MGGSLGAVSMNRAVMAMVEKHILKGELPYQIIWQCGDRYLEENASWLADKVAQHPHLSDSVRCLGFIDRIDLAYIAADIIASRAGAMSISELALVAKPTILIPSPHVAEDHQTKNARSLVDRDAAIMLSDKVVVEKLDEELISLLSDENKCKSMSSALREASRPNACLEIVDLIELTLNT